ncbi:MAG: hypothetical protein WCW52_10955 [Elusimicrobiales bacterium]
MKTTLLVALAVSGIYGFATAQSGLEDAGRYAGAMIVEVKASHRKTVQQPRESSEIVIPRFQRKNFPAPAGGACGLKSFTLLDSESRSVAGAHESSRLSSMGAVIETTSPDCIRDYGVVQFIRGCVYHSRYSLKTGALLDRKLDVTRDLRGARRVVFNHSNYVIDQDGTDPLYIAVPGEADRLAYAYVPKIPLKLRPDTRSMLSDLKVMDDWRQLANLKDHPGPTSVLLAIDVPNGGISIFDERRGEVSASNSSLDFKTCVYRIKDVPVTGDPAGYDTPSEKGGPLQCFAWTSRYTYDAQTRDFVTDKFNGVDPFCAQ